MSFCGLSHGLYFLDPNDRQQSIPWSESTPEHPLGPQ
jgi:hypothetical protein